MSTVDIEIALRPTGRSSPKDPPASAPRIPRITRLMALAVKFEDMVDRGEVRDYADLARLGLVTRARMTQIMNLLLLAPDIQEQILLSPSQFPTLNENRLRVVNARPLWHDQRNTWRRLFSATPTEEHMPFRRSHMTIQAKCPSN